MEGVSLGGRRRRMGSFKNEYGGPGPVPSEPLPRSPAKAALIHLQRGGMIARGAVLALLIRRDRRGSGVAGCQLQLRDYPMLLSCLGGQYYTVGK
jgi:hypothetical protein